MKQMTEYNRASGYLNKIFALLNEKYFESALSKPVITIQSTPKAYGHVSVCDRWISDDKGRKELNIGAGTLNRPIEDIIPTSDRPLSSDIQALKKRFEERYSIYMATGDFEITVDGIPENAVNKIMECL